MDNLYINHKKNTLKINIQILNPKNLLNKVMINNNKLVIYSFIIYSKNLFK